MIGTVCITIFMTIQLQVFVHEGEVNSELVNKTITSYREDTLKMDQLGH